jgi:aspartyl-tRNA synthetase
LSTANASNCADRRLSFFEWNEDEEIDFTQSFLDAAGRYRRAQWQGSARHQAFQYDICNGFEIASGGIRNHLPETMVKAFETGPDRETVGALRRPLPCLPVWRAAAWGMAAGIDRIVMLW